jgi:hypothetical protein
MALANLLNLPVTTELLAQFSWSNMDSHRRINAAIFRQKNGLVIPEFVLDPIPLLDENGLLVWGLNHQAMHATMDQANDVQGEDLSAPNFRNISELSSWMQQHFVEHYLNETKLGIG